MRLEVHTVCEHLCERQLHDKLISKNINQKSKMALRVRAHLFEVALLHKDATGHDQLHELRVFIAELSRNVQHTAPTLALVHRLVDAVGAVAHRRKSHFQRLSVIFEYARDCARKQNKLSASLRLYREKMRKSE